MAGFKIADYEVEKIPELEGFIKISLKNVDDAKLIINKRFKIKYTKFITDADELWMFLGIEMGTGEKYFLTTGASKIAPVLKRAFDDIGVVPDDYDFMIVPYATKNGTGYKIVDPYD